jgi:ABC-type transport system involved in multi-copper enzyme maturation permease subunit
MIRPDVVLAIARAEGRLTRRLVRYWVFLVLAWGFGILGYINYAVFLHRQFSAYSATAAAINPRYLVALYGTWYLLIFLLGLVFLGFDIRARDVRERIVEVLDSKPYSNIELILGRFVGLLVMSWIPVVLITLVLWGLGLAIDEPIEPYSLVDFAVFMAIPAFMFTLGLVFLTSILVKFRLLTVVIVGGLLVGATFGGQLIRVDLGGLIAVTGGFQVGYSSDFIHFGAGFFGFAQRIAYALAGITLALLAATLHPRLDGGSRGRRLGAVGIAAALTAVMFGLNLGSTRTYLNGTEMWRAAHETRRDDPGPDILAMTAVAGIDPGKTLNLDVELRFAAPPDHTLERALFSLNPGLGVASVVDAEGREAGFTFDDGLLEIDLPGPLAPGEETVVKVTAGGFPLENFAYLDAVKNPLTVQSRDAGLFLLGFQPMMFSSGYVALMPGARWLPASGAEIGRGDSDLRPVDFYDLDLTVELPGDWLAAGPGMRRDGPPAPDGRVSYRFAPPAPVPDAALMASRLESRSVDIDGVRFEVLVHPAHVGNLDFFDDATIEIRDWIADRLGEAKELGLEYPYDGFSLVEIPYALRGFGGGWRMDTTLAPPAMVLMRECSFPTARFDVHLEDAEPFRDREGGLPRAKREWLERFFENDFTGGNVFLAAARNYFPYQTAAKGPDRVALDFLCENLVTRLLTGKQSYFSAHIFDRQLNGIIGAVIQRMVGSLQTGEQVDVAAVVIAELTSRMEVWDQALGVALAGLDPWEDPRRTIDVLTLKGDAMSRSLLDELGDDRVALLLAKVREHHQGGNFGREEMIAVSAEAGEDLRSTFELWLDETDLPGFILESAEAFRLPDDEDGSPRYQILLAVRNDEEVGGMLRVRYQAGTTGDNTTELESGDTEPIRVEGKSEIEIGVVTTRPPRWASIRPYLSLNREPFRSDLPNVDEEKIVREEAFVGHRPVEWTLEDAETIVVDDLDDGFTVVDAGGGSGLRLGGRDDDVQTDQGLPVATPLSFSNPPSRWSRRAASSAWGKYRHTLALVKAGDGGRTAVFTARVPRSGPWELQLHLPSQPRTSVTGTWSLEVADTSGNQPAEFDLGGGAEGWNSVGTFEVAEGEVRVEMSDDTDAPYVLADAIRWIPARTTEVASK